MMHSIPIEVSARHVHLSAEDFATLFPGKEMIAAKPLSQPGEFATPYHVNLIAPRGAIHLVRVLGPCRKRTQVEVSASDARTLRMDVPVRLSGDLDGAPGIHLASIEGKPLWVPECLIIAERHVHLPHDLARERGILANAEIPMEYAGRRGHIRFTARARLAEGFAPALHLDTDEWNAFGIARDNAFTSLPRFA